MIYPAPVLKVLRKLFDQEGRTQSNDEFEEISLRNLSGEDTKARPDFQGLVRFDSRGCAYAFVLTKKGEAVAQNGRDVDETLDRLRELQDWLQHAVNPDTAHDVALSIAKVAQDLDDWLSDEGELPVAWKREAPPSLPVAEIIDAVLEEDS